MWRFLTGLAVLTLGFGVSVAAEPLSGQKQIYLVDVTGGKVLIGKIKFSPQSDGVTYEIDLSEGPFAEHFLSMRPFRCLEGPKKHWCHVPYPYELRRRVSGEDLTDLEYDLLFLHKGAAEYGIDMWNGIYYRLQQDSNRLTGQLHEMDMGLLAVPPEAGELRPLGAGDIHEADPDSHWLPQVVIE